MKTKQDEILTGLKILAYLGMIAYAMMCGSQLISWFVSFKNPEIAKHFYAVNQDLFKLRAHDMWYFTSAMSLVIAAGAVKVWIWILGIRLLSKLNLQNPFSPEPANKIRKIACLLFGIWVIGVLEKGYFRWLSKNTGEVLGDIGTQGEFLFMAGIAYIVYRIFKRGIEIEEENRLTV